MEKKINKLGLSLVVVHSIIVIGGFYLESLNTSKGFLMAAILMMDMPASFIVMLIGKPSMGFHPEIVLAITILILGGLQWYFVGWLISRLKQIFFPKVKEQFK